MLFKHSFVTAPNIAAASAYDRVLGFNEPDQPDPQANMTVGQAVADWPSIVAGGAATIVGPAGGSNMEQTGSWTGQFMLDASNPRVDVMSVHYYTNVFNNPVTAANNMMAYLLAIYRQWRRPLILSEFGMIDFQPGGPANWLYPTVQQAIDTQAEMVRRLRTTSWVVRFAWYPNGLDQSDIDTNPNSANVRLADSSANLTALGIAYRNAIEIPHNGVLT